MVGFYAKEISNPPRLGQKLKDQRLEKGKSLSQVSAAIGIAQKYLAAIEAGDFDQLPGEIYARNFLKAYTEYLGLDSQEFLDYYQSEQKIYAKTKITNGKDHKKPIKRIARRHLVVTPKVIKGVIIGLLAFACLVYLGLKIKDIITPPTLKINQPVENLVILEKFISVAGSVEGKDVILAINGQQVFIDKSGNFNEMVDLQLGNNIIEISAKKRHSRETKIYRQVVVVDADENN